MKILAFDTALGGCGVAVIDTVTGVAISEIRPMARGQSEILVPMIQQVMQDSGCVFSDLNLIATTVGPGAFTGLRIGLSTARSFGLALDIPVDGILTTEAIAADFCNKNNNLQNDLLVVLETKRSDYYIHSFSSNNNGIDKAIALSLELLVAQYQDRALTLCGDGLNRLQTELAQNWPKMWKPVAGFDLTDPVLIATIAAERRALGTVLPADPVYLRGADVSVSTRPARTIAGSS